MSCCFSPVMSNPNWTICLCDDNLKTRQEPTPWISHTSSICHRVDSVQHNIHIANQEVTDFKISGSEKHFSTIQNCKSHWSCNTIWVSTAVPQIYSIMLKINTNIWVLWFLFFVNKVMWFNTENCKLIILGVYGHQKALARLSLRVPVLQYHHSTRSSISFGMH
jgi:hypothetical protein